MYPQGKEKPVALKWNQWRGKFLDPTVPSWGHSRVSKKVPFPSGLFRLLWGSKAKRSQTKQWLTLEVVTANSGQVRSWFWKVSAGKHSEICTCCFATNFFPKRPLPEVRGQTKFLKQANLINLNKIAATGQQTSVSWILLFKWRTVISWKMQGCWAVL